MKKKSLLTFLFLLGMLISFCLCCTDDDGGGRDDLKAELTSSPTNLEFTALGGEKKVVVSTKLDSWNIIPDDAASWCIVTKGDGEFIVNVEEFAERRDRKATLKITSGCESLDFIVIQKAVSADLNLEKTEVSINGFGTAVKIKITGSSDEWIATSEESWIHPEKDGEDLVIRAALSSSDRTGKVQVLLNDAKSEITVNQIGTETTIGSVVFGEDNATAIGVIVNKVDSTNCIYVVSLEEEALEFTPEDKFYIYTDSLKVNGQKATACFKEDKGYKEKFPVIAYCDRIEEQTGMRGWYIPAYKEQEIWQALSDNKKTINTTLKALNADILLQSVENMDPQYQNCWTSTTRSYKEDGYAMSVRTKIMGFSEDNIQYAYYKHAARCFLKIEYLTE